MAAELSDAWQVAYEQDLRSGDVLGDWLALTGDWSLGADGIISEVYKKRIKKEKE